MKIFDDMLDNIPKGMDLTHYCFICSKDIGFDGNSYRGFDVFSYNIVKEKTVYLMYWDYKSEKEWIGEIKLEGYANV